MVLRVISTLFLAANLNGIVYQYKVSIHPHTPCSLQYIEARGDSEQRTVTMELLDCWLYITVVILSDRLLCNIQCILLIHCLWLIQCLWLRFNRVYVIKYFY